MEQRPYTNDTLQVSNTSTLTTSITHAYIRTPLHVMLRHHVQSVHQPWKIPLLAIFTGPGVALFRSARVPPKHVKTAKTELYASNKCPPLSCSVHWYSSFLFPQTAPQHQPTSQSCNHYPMQSISCRKDFLEPTYSHLLLCLEEWLEIRSVTPIIMKCVIL